MESIKIEENEYEIIKNYRNGYKKDDFIARYTEYFKDYDYIFGDWAYGKLRLKGFYDKTNHKCKQINDINNLEKYIKENCAFDCSYFVAKRK
ncbi:MAG: YutD-like domain-containing protein [Bacilli bacterium]